MLPLILAAARAALPTVAGRAAAGGGASRLLSTLQFGAGTAAGSKNTNSTPPTESNPVHTR
ncbi:hypothetical protein ACIOEX_21705 [Streptomyces sp. NPDC087850]|uniref:hypothetical protein n=1 Tax=Streptomyces sp. NPDC087850 TaxID=3365809 RepID=UPI00380720F5